MTSNTIFEYLKLNPFGVNDSLNDTRQSLDVNFFPTNVFPLDADYISSSDFNENSKDFSGN